MSTSIRNIPISCNWHGNSCAITSWGGPLSLHTISLTASEGISVQFPIPALLTSKSIPLLFFSAPESNFLSNILNLSHKQLQNLTLTAYFSEKRPDFTRRIDFKTGRIFRDTKTVPSTRSIPLQLPTTIEPLMAYQLEISSHQLHLSAQLIAAKPLPPIQIESHWELAIVNVSSLASTALCELIEDAVIIFYLKLLSLNKDRDLSPNNTIKEKPVIQKAIDLVVRQMPPEQLTSLSISIQAIKEECLQASSKREMELQQMAIRHCLHSLGTERIEIIISEVLRQTFDTRALPPQAESIIKCLAQSCATQYMNELDSIHKQPEKLGI